MFRYGELEKRRKRSIDFERKQSKKISNEKRNGNFSNRIKRTVNAVFKLPNNDGTKVRDTKNPWEALLFMILGKESTGKPTPFGMEFNQLLCPFFRSETDTYDMSEIRRQELENKMKIKQCSGSLITNKHILTSAECVTKNSEYLRQDINIFKKLLSNH